MNGKSFLASAVKALDSEHNLDVRYEKWIHEYSKCVSC